MSTEVLHKWGGTSKVILCHLRQSYITNRTKTAYSDSIRGGFDYAPIRLHTAQTPRSDTTRPLIDFYTYLLVHNQQLSHYSNYSGPTLTALYRYLRNQWSHD